MYFLYNLAIWLAAPVLAVWICCRLLTGRLPGVVQRLGMVPETPRDGNQVIWLHGVSLGEAKLAAFLATELRRRLPDVRIVTTASTRTGWEEALRKAGPGDLALFPPFDYGWICRRFLRRLKPD